MHTSYPFQTVQLGATPTPIAPASAAFLVCQLGPGSQKRVAHTYDYSAAHRIAVSWLAPYRSMDTHAVYVAHNGKVVEVYSCWLRAGGGTSCGWGNATNRRSFQSALEDGDVPGPLHGLDGMQFGYVVPEQYRTAVGALINLVLMGGGALLGFNIGRRSWAGAVMGALAGYGVKRGADAVSDSFG